MMALLDKDNLAALEARRRKYRLNHVGTKLNEAELQEFLELAERRNQKPSELIRDLIMRELKQDRQGQIPSPELVEITAVRLMLVNMFQPLIVGGAKLPQKTWDHYLEQVRNLKIEVAEEALSKITRQLAGRAHPNKP